jgi:hypothetical protein
MPATLSSFRDRVEVALMDTSNEIWSTTVLEEAIRQALAEYSKVYPRRVIGMVTLAASGREVDISSLSGVLRVVRVWLPYTAASPEDPPNQRYFEHWRDQQKLWFKDEPEPASGEVLRVFYTAMQTLDDLDSAAATTFPDDDETLLVLGASGYAASSRAVDLLEQVSRDRLTPQQVRAWGLGRLQEFRAGLKAVQRRLAMETSAWIGAAQLDRHDKWGGWS